MHVDGDAANDGHHQNQKALMPVNWLEVASIVDVHEAVVDESNVHQAGHGVVSRNWDGDLVVVDHKHLKDAEVVEADIRHNFYSFVPVVVADAVTFVDADVSLNNMAQYSLPMIQVVDDAILGVVLEVAVQTFYDATKEDHNFHMQTAYVAVVVEKEEVVAVVVVFRVDHHLILEVYCLEDHRQDID